jgi:hypothetical protein
MNTPATTNNSKDQWVSERVSPHVAKMRLEQDWFLAVDVGTSSERHYNRAQINTDLRASILSGVHRKDSVVVIHAKSTKGVWNETRSSLFDFAKGHFKLRVLYQPRWTYAVEGLKWGAIVGIGLKLLDTAWLLSTVNPTLALLFLGTIAVCFIPRIGVVGVMAISILMIQFTQVNLFLAVLTASLIGATLGCLPGMAVGGIIGLTRRVAVDRALDRVAEPGPLWVKAVLFPSTAGAAVLAFYVFVVNPWITGLLE